MWSLWSLAADVKLPSKPRKTVASPKDDFPCFSTNPRSARNREKTRNASPTNPSLTKAEKPPKYPKRGSPSGCNRELPK